jgi:hypothetical protein
VLRCLGTKGRGAIASSRVPSRVPAQRNLYVCAVAASVAGGCTRKHTRSRCNVWRVLFCVPGHRTHADGLTKAMSLQRATVGHAKRGPACAGVHGTRPPGIVVAAGTTRHGYRSRSCCHMWRSRRTPAQSRRCRPALPSGIRRLPRWASSTMPSTCERDSNGSGAGRASPRKTTVNSN